LTHIRAVYVLPVFRSGGVVIKERLAQFLGMLLLDVVAGLARDAGVVDQDGEMFLARLKVPDQLGDSALLGDVGCDRDDLAGDVFAV
jgi:hypothetical protein